MKNLIALVLIFWLIVGVSNVSNAQNSNFTAVKVLVLPSVKTGESLRSKVATDVNLADLIQKITDAFSNHGFTSQDFNATLKEVSTVNSFTNGTNEKSALIAYAKIDIYIDVEWQLISAPGGNTVKVVLNARNADDNTSYTKITCDSRQMHSEDLPALMLRALSLPIPPINFTDDETRSHTPCLEDFIGALELKLTNDVIAKLVTNRNAKIAAANAQSCQLAMAKADHELLSKKYDTARDILLTITDGNAGCYDKAQQKIEDTYNKQFGNLDEAAAHYRKEVIIDPDNKSFWKNLNLLNKLIQVRNEKDSSPPQIIITKPSGTDGSPLQAEVDNGRIYVSGYATDRSGVTAVTVNGKAVNDFLPDGFFSLNVDAKTTELAIIAVDKKNHITSKTFKLQTKPISISPTSVAPANDNSTYHAIFIANDKYTNGLIQLPTVESEERKIINVLEMRYKFKPQNVDTLFNKNHKELVAVLMGTMGKLTENDNLIIYYGGHGMSENAESYWIPIDAQKQDYISNTMLDSVVSNCRARHILIISDACYSGGMRGAIISAPTGTAGELSPASRQILASTKFGEVAPSVSIFAKRLFNVLQSNINTDISAKQLQIQMTNYDGAKTDPDDPIFPLIHMWVPKSQGGQFYFRLAIKGQSK